LLIKAGLGTLGKVNTVDPVRLLVVLCDDGRTGESLLDSVIAILVAPLGVLSSLVHQLKHRVSANNLEADVDVEESPLFFHDQARVKSGPNLDIVGIK